MNANTLVNRFYAVLRSTLGSRGETSKARQARERSDLAQECLCVLLTELRNGKRHKRADIEQTIAYVFKRLRIKSIPAQRCIHVYHVHCKARAATPERRYTVYGARPNRKHVQFDGYTIRDNVSLQTWIVTIPEQTARQECIREIRSTRAPENMPEHYRYVRTDNIGYRKEAHAATLTRPLDDLLETCTLETDTIRNIIKLLGQGYRKGEIAKRLGMKEGTVRSLVSRFKATIPDTLAMDTRYPERACQSIGAVTTDTLLHLIPDTKAYDTLGAPSVPYHEFWTLDILDVPQDWYTVTVDTQYKAQHDTHRKWTKA